VEIIIVGGALYDTLSTSLGQIDR